MTTPAITIFTRHSTGCKYAGDELAKRCTCRKWLRWTHNGKRHRQPAKTRAWAEAEKAKRALEDQFAGAATATGPTDRSIAAAIEVFLQDKRVQGVASDTVATYERELARLRDYCERHTVFVVSGLTREVLTGYASTFERSYQSSVTRSKVRERCRTFLRFCYEAQWLERVPAMPRIKVEARPTLPLSAEDFLHLLASIPVGLPHPQAARKRVRVRALFLVMRWSGLAIRDALGLKRTDLIPGPGFYRVVTKRQKTKTDVSVPIPTHVAEEVLAVPNSHPDYLFWTGNSDPGNHATKWQTRYVAPVFKAAGLYGDGRMVSHRLRDTFAVDLLEKGVPLEEVSKALGHTSIKTTEKHYSAWVRGRQDRLDNLIVGTW